MGYQSKFTGKQIDTILESVQNGSSNIELIEVRTDINTADLATPFTLTEDDKEINRQAIAKVYANPDRCLLYTKLKNTYDTQYIMLYITMFEAYEETIGSGIIELDFILETDALKMIGSSNMVYIINSSGEIINKISIDSIIGGGVLERLDAVDLSDVQNAYDLYNKLSSSLKMLMEEGGSGMCVNIPVRLPLKTNSSFLFGGMIDYTLDFIYLANDEDGMSAIGYFSTKSGEYGVIYATPEQFITAVTKNGNIYLNPRVTEHINQNKHLAYLIYNLYLGDIVDLSTFKLIGDGVSYSITCAAGATGFFINSVGNIGSFTLNSDGSITINNADAE